MTRPQLALTTTLLLGGMTVSCGGKPEASSCAAASLESFAQRVEWVAARQLDGNALLASFAVSDTELSPLTPADANVILYTLTPTGLRVDGHEVADGDLSPEDLLQAIDAGTKIAQGVAAAHGIPLDEDHWQLIVEPKTPARHVASLLMALRYRGRVHGAVVFAVPVEPAAGAIDHKLLEALGGIDRVQQLADRLESEFPCTPVQQVILGQLERPAGTRASYLREQLPAAMQSCDCKPDLPAYHALLVYLALGTSPLDRVGVAVPWVIDLSEAPLHAAEGATWEAIAAQLDSAAPRRGWVTVPDLAIPDVWRAEATSDCTPSLGEACVLACELGDAPSCARAAPWKARAALDPATRACAEHSVAIPNPPPFPPLSWPSDTKALEAAPVPTPVKAQPTRFARVERDDRAELLTALGIEGPCDPEPWLRKQRERPDEESLYCVLSLVYEQCDKPEEAMKWATERTKAFPRSAAAWVGLAARYHAPAGVDPPLPPGERLALGTAMLDATAKAMAVDPKARAPHDWAASAYRLRASGRVVGDAPSSLAEHLEAFLYRDDIISAWREQQSSCGLGNLAPCTIEGPRPCCAPLPWDPVQVAAHDELKAKLAFDRD